MKICLFQENNVSLQGNEGRAEHENVGFLEFPIALQFNQHWIKILRFVD